MEKNGLGPLAQFASEDVSYSQLLDLGCYYRRIYDQSKNSWDGCVCGLVSSIEQMLLIKGKEIPDGVEEAVKEYLQNGH